MSEFTYNLPVPVAKPKRARRILLKLFLLSLGWKVLLVAAIAAGFFTL